MTAVNNKERLDLPHDYPFLQEQVIILLSQQSYYILLRLHAMRALEIAAPVLGGEQSQKYASVPDEENAPPVAEGATVAPPPSPDSSTGRRCTFKRTIQYLVLFVAVYGIGLWAFVQIFSKSRPNGYHKEDQHLGPFSLLLLPLTPWIRSKNKEETPAVARKHMEEIQPDLYVASMPLLEMSHEDPNDFDLQMHMGSELSGCDPKFVLEGGGNKYLFKPNKDPHKVWNELLAYYVNHLGGFERVPTTWPYQVSVSAIENPKGKEGSIQNMPFVKCNFDLDNIDQWIQNDDMMIGTLQLMVSGVSKRSKVVNRIRTKIGKWTDRKPPLSTFAQREINTRTVFDFIVGNYDRYNNDFIQTQSNGDKVLVYIDQGSFVEGEYITWNQYMLEDYCKFYWDPIARLREETLYDQVMETFKSNEITKGWVEKNLIGFEDHPTIKHMQLRIEMVLNAVDKCLDANGHDYVFLR